VGGRVKLGVFEYARISILPALLVSLSISAIVLAPNNVSGRSSHDPISIDGDSGFTILNGVVSGSGTPADPYLIQGWDISALGASGAAIHINNTMASFVIRDVSVSSTGTGTGIVLENLFNGTVEGVTVSNFDRGISFLHTDNSTIDSCGVYNSVNAGVWLYDTVNMTVRRCTFENNKDGILILDYRWAHHKYIDGNAFVGNQCGISASVTYAAITNNSFSMNGVGLICGGGWTTVTKNLFSDSTSYAVQIVANGPSNKVWNNTFVDNNGAGASYDSSHIQAYDDGANTHWDDGVFGNYWSDWQSPDANHDGIVDIPYNLADNPIHLVAGSDNYPLTTEPVIPEFASMPVVTIVSLAIFLLVLVVRRRDV